MKVKLVNESQNQPIVATFDEQLLAGYPLANVTEKNLKLSKGWELVSLDYRHPVGNEKTGRLDVLAESKTGDRVNNVFDLPFNYSWNQRIEEIRRPASFKIRPDSLIKKNYRHLQPQDIEVKYDDVVVDRVVYSAQPFLNVPKDFDSESEDLRGYAMVEYHLSGRSPGDEQVYKVQLPIITSHSVEKRLQPQVEKTQYIKVDRPTETSPINVDTEIAIEKGLIIPINQVKRYTVDRSFVRGAPPLKISSSIVTAKPGAKLRKVVYMPPASIDETRSYLQVEYYYDGRIFNEQVEFDFGKTIREEAESLVSRIKPRDFVYLPLNRLAPPTFIRAEQFSYQGPIQNLRLVDVEYHYDQIREDDRFVDMVLVVAYRSVNLLIPKRLEFKYSKRQYVSGRWQTIRVENGSVDIGGRFYDPVVLHDLYRGDETLVRELKKSATIVPGYRYESIKDIKLVGFKDDSRYATFRITAVERYGNNLVEWPFEKWIKLSESYNDYKLGQIGPDDIKINQDLLPPFPTSHLPVSVFEVNPRFRVLSVHYKRPPANVKEVEVDVKIGTLTKAVIIAKQIVFKQSREEHQNAVRDQSMFPSARIFSPNLIKIAVDLEGEPVLKITPDMVRGIPEDINYRVEYEPPQVGRRDTRVIVHLERAGRREAYEQTIVFAQPRPANN